MIRKQQQIPENLETKVKIDQKDRAIVNILVKNSRSTLKEIGREVGLSIDAVKDRIDKMKANGTIKHFTVKVKRSAFGLNVAIHVYIRLKDIKEERFSEMLTFLKNHYRIPLVISMMGDYDLNIVIFAENNMEMNKTTLEIREKFSDIIDEWKEVFVGKVHKSDECKF